MDTLGHIGINHIRYEERLQTRRRIPAPLIPVRHDIVYKTRTTARSIYRSTVRPRPASRFKTEIIRGMPTEKYGLSRNPFAFPCINNSIGFYPYGRNIAFFVMYILRDPTCIHTIVQTVPPGTGRSTVIHLLVNFGHINCLRKRRRREHNRQNPAQSNAKKFYFHQYIRYRLT